MSRLRLYREPIRTSYILIGLNLIILLVMLIVGNLFYNRILSSLNDADRRYLLEYFVGTFPAGGYIGFVLNNLILLIFGPMLEDRIGRFGFLAYFFVTGVLVLVLSFSLALILGTGIPGPGMTGSVYALLLAYAVFHAGERVSFIGIPLAPSVALLILAAINLARALFGRIPVVMLFSLSGILFGMLYLRVIHRVRVIEELTKR